MVKRVVCVVVLGALLVGLSAQSALAGVGGGGRGTRGAPLTGQAYVDSLKERLGLTDEQVTKVKALVDLRDQKVQAAGEDREARRAAFTEFMDGLRGILTAEQQARMARGFQPGGATGVLATATRLDAAVRALEGVDEATRTKIDQMRGERDKQLETAVNAYRDRIMPLLTPAQQQALKTAIEAPAAGARQPAAGGRQRRGGQGGTTPNPTN